jgi:enoyl-CoA hydratase
MLTGDSVDGQEAVRMGLANRCFKNEELEARVLDVAERIAKIPPDLQQLNKRSIHRAMEIMGMRAAIKAGTEIQALAFHQKSSREYLKEFAKGVTQALSKRDAAFGDYRERKK